MRSWALADLDDLPWRGWGKTELVVFLLIDAWECRLYRRLADRGVWEYELRSAHLPSIRVHYEDNDPLKLQAILFDAAERGAIELAHNQNSMR